MKNREEEEEVMVVVVVVVEEVMSVCVCVFWEEEGWLLDRYLCKEQQIENTKIASHVETGQLGSKGGKILQFATPNFPPSWQFVRLCNLLVTLKAFGISWQCLFVYQLSKATWPTTETEKHLRMLTDFYLGKEAETVTWNQLKTQIFLERRWLSQII